MTDLPDLLERTAAKTPVGLPPLAALHTAATRHRRRRTAGVTVVTVVAVAAVIGSTTVLTSHKPLPPAAAPTPAPPTLRLVGFGHAAIAVPADWPRNKSFCGTPTQNTVQIDDPSMYTECGTTRPDNVDSVQLSSSPTVGFQADQTFVIHGLQAERQQTSCRNDWNGTKVCSGVVSIPSLNVWFRAESSTSAENVDRMLSRIQIVPDQVGVPDPWSVTGPPTGPLLSGYTPLLTEAGLKVQSRRVKSPNYPSGTILGVSPATGTMLPLGATVTVTVAK